MIDYSEFCPKTEFQVGGTCYAYAVAYTAYSTQYNILNGIKDRARIERDAFSYMYVASVVRRIYLPFHKRIFDVHCSWLGTAEKSLATLKDWGCTMISEHDYSCQDGVKLSDVQLAEKHKIKDYKTITSDYIFSDDAITLIVDELKKGVPVCTAIFSTEEFHENKASQMTLTNLNENQVQSNHVVCIVGFDEKQFDGKGAYLVKNNYDGWGKDGFCWIRCSDFMHLIEESYSIVI